VELGWSFVEIASLIPHCKLPSCLHQQEPNCAVRDHASIEASRYDSYLRLLGECTTLHRESTERSTKIEPGFKRRSEGAGKHAKLVKIDTNARNRDRRTHKQGLVNYWKTELDESAPNNVKDID